MNACHKKINDVQKKKIKPTITDKELKKLTLFNFLYFSVITATTVGFGDISPISPFAQLLTMLNSILGLIMFAAIGNAFGTFLRRFKLRK